MVDSESAGDQRDQTVAQVGNRHSHLPRYPTLPPGQLLEPQPVRLPWPAEDDVTEEDDYEVESVKSDVDKERTDPEPDEGLDYLHVPCDGEEGGQDRGNGDNGYVENTPKFLRSVSVVFILIITYYIVSLLTI